MLSKLIIDTDISLISKNQVEFVVARYNEDLSWSEPIKHLCTVYNKGPELEGFPTVVLPNVGREAHTYLTHIIRNYDKLADITVFFQGAINDRAEQILLPISRYLGKGTFPKGNVHVSIRGVLRFSHKIAFSQPRLCAGVSDYQSVGDFNRRVTKKKVPSYFSKWFPGAYFSVDKKSIQKNKVGYYEDIISNTKLGTALHPEDAHYMERLWYYIFR